MKSRKGEYYIVCRKNGEMYLHKKTGIQGSGTENPSGAQGGRAMERDE